MAGASYLGHCKRILSEVEAAEALAASSHRELSGALAITAPVLFGRLHVTPIVTAFLKRHPRVSMRVLFADNLLDFFDVADDVAGKRLRIVLAEHELAPVPVHVVRVEGRDSAARVRAFADFAFAQLRAALAPG